MIEKSRSVGTESFCSRKKATNFESIQFGPESFFIETNIRSSIACICHLANNTQELSIQMLFDLAKIQKRNKHIYENQTQNVLTVKLIND